jgi:Ca2+-binding EF-hand superfamily protein
MELCKSDNQFIHAYDLQNLLENWGFNLNKEQFKYIFNRFDADGDGVISFGDLKKVVGKEITPLENQFFRWDKKV